LRFCRIFKKRGVLAIAGCDTQANGSFRQYLAGIIAPYYLHKSIDVLWVTGERQRQLAYKLGFKGNKCWDGFYSCDWNSFSQIYPSEKNNSFLYVGRLIERKGIRTLIEAYQNYRNETINPWNLVIAGTGPLSKLFAPIEGISHLGFVQPNGLPDLFSKSKVFILPSEVEPWGVVLHEAITAGLPILTTNESGAGVHLVKNGFNGFKYDANDTEALTYYLSFFSRQNEDNWKIMSSNSKLLSKLYTPNLWAETLQTGLKELLPHA
jgi:glycosyltransferase involved in cell wall biosynthesis